MKYIVIDTSIILHILRNNATASAALKDIAEIDAFSKRKTPDKSGKLLKGSARKMGKNDLWIAATARLLDAPLMTTDGDFDHLNGVYINLKKY